MNNNNAREAKRLSAVNSFEVLDSAAESEFDDLVSLAAMIFNVPISTVTILDAHRQWFKAAVGISVKETPRDISFCTHAIELADPLVVENASQDARFSSNPLVTQEPNLRFYAGVPLRTSDEQAIGTFCIMSDEPRQFSPHELETLKILANQAMQLLELRAERNRFRDLVIERDQIYQRLKESEQRWKFALEGAGDGVWDWDIKTQTVIFSKRWKEMLGYSETDIESNYDAWVSIIFKDDLNKALNNLNAYLNKETDIYAIEHRLLCKDNTWKWVLSRGMVVEWDKDGQPARMVGTHTDISKNKESEEAVWKQANFDALTGLPNRRMFFDRLNSEIKKSSRLKHLFALMFIDLDGFKEVNDQLGHQAGDELLMQVSKRISQAIRDSDTLARLGGDEFTIILSNIGTLQCIGKVADKILATLNEPFKLNAGKATISASIGISVYPDHGKDSDTLISHADTAMYDAKAKGKNCWMIYKQP